MWALLIVGEEDLLSQPGPQVVSEEFSITSTTPVVSVLYLLWSI